MKITDVNEAKEYWYLSKLKTHFGASINEEEILGTYGGLNYIKLCNMLTLRELDIEWVEAFSEKCELKYKQYPVCLSEVVQELRNSESEIAEVMGRDGKIARLTKTAEYKEYIELLNKKIDALKQMYGVADENVQENVFYKMNLLHFENHPKDENSYKVYRDKNNNLCLGHLMYAPSKKRSAVNGEMIKGLIENLKKYVTKIMGGKCEVILDLEGVDVVGNRLYHSPRIENGMVKMYFEVVPEKNELTQTMIKFKELWAHLFEEKFGTEKYRLLKKLNPLMDFKIQTDVDVEVEPYGYDKVSSEKIKSKLYEQMPTYERMYYLLETYDKSRIIDNSNEQFEKQLENLFKVLDKLEFYDVQKEIRQAKGKISLKWLELDKSVLESIQSTSSEVWFDQETLVNKMYWQAKGLINQEYEEDLNALFFGLHCRTADEGEMLAEYVNHELVYNLAIRKEKMKGKYAK